MHGLAGNIDPQALGCHVLGEAFLTELEVGLYSGKLRVQFPEVLPETQQGFLGLEEGLWSIRCVDVRLEDKVCFILCLHWDDRLLLLLRGREFLTDLLGWEVAGGPVGLGVCGGASVLGLVVFFLATGGFGMSSGWARALLMGEKYDEKVKKGEKNEGGGEK